MTPSDGRQASALDESVRAPLKQHAPSDILRAIAKALTEDADAEQRAIERIGGFSFATPGHQQRACAAEIVECAGRLDLYGSWPLRRSDVASADATKPKGEFRSAGEIAWETIRCVDKAYAIIKDEVVNFGVSLSPPEVDGLRGVVARLIDRERAAAFEAGARSERKP